MRRNGWTRLIGIALVAAAGFAAGRFSTATPAAAETVPQADDLPKTRFHAMTSVHTIPGTSSNQNVLNTEFPERDLPRGSKEGTLIAAIQALPYLAKADPIYVQTNQGTRWNGELLVQFANVEEFTLRWMDRNETDWNPLAHNSYHPRNHAYWKNHGADFFLFPPPDPDDREAEFTWVVTRHANGRIKTVTPFIGNVLRGEGRRHGMALKYNEKGGLVSMAPYVNGRIDGEMRLYDGGSRSRLQKPKSVVKYSGGRRVLDKPAAPLRRPGGLIPKKK